MTLHLSRSLRERSWSISDVGEEGVPNLALTNPDD
jgi:hypothetical protein